MKKKALYSILCALLLIFGSGYCYLTRENAKLEKAHRALLQGYYQKCDEQLSKIKPKKLMHPLALYRGYSLVLQQNIDEARAFFLRAEESVQDHSLLHLECILAKGCCDYQKRDFSQLKKLLSGVGEQYQEHGWIHLLKGFSAYEEGRYSDAIRFWSSVDYDLLDEAPLATTWASMVFKQLFTKEVVDLALGCALVEENDCFLGREILERLMQSESVGRIQNLASLYLGYSYIKEAEQYPLTQRASFYQLAAFYFERSTISYLSHEQKELFAQKLLEKADQILQNDPFIEEPFLYLILPLQKWQSIDQLELLSQKVIEKLRLCHTDSLISLLLTQLKGSLFHRLINDQLTIIVLQEIGKGEFSTLPELLELTELLLTESASFRQKCHSLILTHLDHAILRDDDHLQQLQAYVQILERLVQSDEGRGQLTNKLLEQSKILWQERGGELKATKLMQIAFELSPNKVSTKEAVEHYLTALFDQAEASNLVERLSLIYDALVIFNLKTKRLLDPAVLANHLADAHYRFQAGNFSCSKVLSSWVLKLDPSNQDALRLLGLNYYHLGDYQGAIASLQKLLILDQDSYNALLLSEVISLSNQSHLVQIDNLDAFEVDK